MNEAECIYEGGGGRSRDRGRGGRKGWKEREKRVRWNCRGKNVGKGWKQRREYVQGISEKKGKARKIEREGEKKGRSIEAEDGRIR